MRVRRSDLVVIILVMVAALITIVVLSRGTTGVVSPATQEAHATTSSSAATPSVSVTTLSDVDENGLPIKRYVGVVYRIDPNGEVPVSERTNQLQKLVADGSLGEVQKDMEARNTASRQRNLQTGTATVTNASWGDEGEGRAITFVTIAYIFPSGITGGERRKISWQQVIGKGWVVTADEPAT